MNYFDITNESLKPYIEYENYVLYCIDIKNKSAGIEFIFDFANEQVSYYEQIINEALKTAFEEYGLHKVYVNVVRDNFKMFYVLKNSTSSLKQSIVNSITTKIGMTYYI